MSAKKIQPSRIIGVQFSMLSPEEIRKNSVVEITNRDTYINNKPVIGGLFDPRMGTIDPNIICPTDGMTYIDTPGYFGHIELSRPVFYMQHFKEIVKICKCVCFKCSKLLIDKEQHSHILEWDSEARWNYVYDIASKVKRCSFANQDGCGCKQFDRIKVDNMSFIYAIWDNVKTQATTEGGEANTDTLSMRLTPEIVLKIFKRISDDDIHFMGFSPVFSRPEWFICEVLGVPPPAMRPSVKHDANQRSEDDLTQIYITIIKTNNDLKEKIKSNAAAHIIDNIAGYMQFYIANIANNKIKGSATPMTQRSGRPLQCIRDRLDRKNGRIRGNLMGKRVDFSARSVITADPNLSILELGVPMKVAKNLTKPVVVNDLNRDFLLKLVQNGPEVYPGAKILERRNGENISLMYIDRLSIKLENGDIVHRHLMDGDAVLFNRQPSLHKMSMMCHLVKVMKQGDTFRLHVSVTKPYNADFDGDEMNMHAPQNVAAETELRHLAAVPFQLISPSNNSPIIGIFQDSLLGSYRFTRENLQFSAREAMNLLMMFPRVVPSSLFTNSRDQVTNFEILSQIMPPISLFYKTKLFEEEPGQKKETSNHVLEIRNGQYIRGQMEKGVLGSGTKGILHRTCNDIGNMACSDFIDNLQHVIMEYMKVSSYSVGIGDLIADAVTQTKIVEIITEQKREVQTLIDRVHLGVFENNTANTNMVEFEKQVNAILNKAAEQSGKIGRNNLDPNNRFVTIVKCGSKGSTLNISQMISCLGQQNVDGKRIPYGFDNRTLPHFTKFDDSPGARGFIENSYIHGLTAPQLFFHAMGGRIGLIDTACKSVVWETPIIIIENNKPIYIEIGRWIDAKLAAANPKSIEKYEEKNMELLNLLNSREIVYIPTTDENGVVTWANLTAVTRHDPGDRLYEVTTETGRKVTVAESNSLLIWDSTTAEFHEMNSSNVKIGDFMPVTVELSVPHVLIESIEWNKEIYILNRVIGFIIGKCLSGQLNEEQVKEYDFVCYITDNLKKIPNEAFVGPNEFIEGIVDGFFDIEKVIITQYETICNGITMLCNRVGISTIIERFSENYKIHMSNPSIYRQNDVLLDKIIKITIISPENHPKLYDVTVPSTLNFCLANGLHVRDTSQTGYIQRRLIKGLEDLKIEYDMTVRNSKGKIIQFTYGDDGIETTRIESQVLPLGGMSIQDIYSLYDIPTESEIVNLIYTKGTATRFNTQQGELKEKCAQYIKSALEWRDDVIHRVFRNKSDNSVKAPVAFPYIISNVQGQMNLGANTLVDITPLEAFQLIENNMRLLEKNKYAKPTLLFKILYNYYLNPKDIVVNKRFHRKALVLLLEQINLNYKRSLVHPGEMVGVIAGQSIGEPTTQMTLNTFHFSGVASKSNVTRGVPRIEEIMRLTKNPKNPSMNVFLRAEDEFDKEKAAKYTHILEHTKLSDVVKSMQIYFDPDDNDTNILEDKVWLKQYYEFEKMLSGCSGQSTEKDISKSKWIIRIEMDAEEMLDKNITMDDIHYAIISYSQNIHCAYTDYNEDNLIFRLRLSNEFLSKPKKKSASNASPLDQTDELYMLNNFQETVLNDIVLRGINGITKVMPYKLQGYVTYEEDKYVVKDRWVLDTTGSNLLETLALDFIDPARTYSNDIKEIYNILGIEATRQIIYNELVEVIEFSGAYVNSHHLQLLADRMTSTKNLVPIFRSGILYDDIGPIAKATFEVHTEEFLSAARHSALDHMRGISANVMTGQNGYYGTSAFQVVLDLNKLVEGSVDMEPTAQATTAAARLDSMIADFERMDVYGSCAREKIGIKNNIKNIVAVDLGKGCASGAATGVAAAENDIGF